MKAQINGIPTDAVPVHGFNAVDIIDGTARDILPAPATDKRYYITRIVPVNETEAASPVLVLQDDTPTELLYLIPSKPSNPRAPLEFDPPIKLGFGKKLQGKATLAVGASTITAFGYVGS